VNTKPHLFIEVIIFIITSKITVNSGSTINVNPILIVKMSGKSLLGNEYNPLPTKYKSKYMPINDANK
jgi:hypothetical protein